MEKVDVKLPELGEGVTEGELVKWLVQVGDQVSADQPVAEMMTDKATVEVPTPVSGTVRSLKAKPGDIVPIETVILELEASDTGKPKQREATAPTSTPAAPLAPTAATVAMASPAAAIAPPPTNPNVLATPSTRRLAREMMVDLNLLQGTGLAGRVTRDDVIQAATHTGVGATAAGLPTMPTSNRRMTTSSTAEERVPLRGIRRKIAEQMQLTKQIVPHFTIMDEAKVGNLVNTREAAKAAAEARNVKVTYLPFVMKALVSTLREFPQFNASIDDQAQEIVYKKYVNIGFAADTPQGLLVPVIHRADEKTILEISEDIQVLARKARDGKLSAEEMRGATITITNIGSVGGTYATPIINHPEVAIIGMYKIWTKPVWNGSAFLPEPTMNLSATCDHRLIDGAVAANFLKALVERLENPSRLLLDMR